MISERFWLNAQHTPRYRDRTEARSQWLRRFSREKRDDMHTAGAKSTLRSCDEPRRSRFCGYRLTGEARKLDSAHMYAQQLVAMPGQPRGSLGRGGEMRAG